MDVTYPKRDEIVFVYDSTMTANEHISSQVSTQRIIEAPLSLVFWSETCIKHGRENTFTPLRTTIDTLVTLQPGCKRSTFFARDGSPAQRLLSQKSIIAVRKLDDIFLHLPSTYHVSYYSWLKHSSSSFFGVPSRRLSYGHRFSGKTHARYRTEFDGCRERRTSPPQQRRSSSPARAAKQ